MTTAQRRVAKRLALPFIRDQSPSFTVVGIIIVTAPAGVFEYPPRSRQCESGDRRHDGDDEPLTRQRRVETATIEDCHRQISACYEGTGQQSGFPRRHQSHGARRLHQFLPRAQMTPRPPGQRARANSQRRDRNCCRPRHGRLRRMRVHERENRPPHCRTAQNGQQYRRPADETNGHRGLFHHRSIDKLVRCTPDVSTRDSSAATGP